MRSIELTRGKESIVDDELFPLLSKIKWCISGNGNYAVHSFRVGQRRTFCYLHHYIVGKPLNNLEVDHLNGNKLDNQRNNLRLVSHRDNMRNLSVHRSGRLTGTCRVKKRYHSKPWQASIHIAGRTRFLGMFGNEIEAHQAYQKAKEKYRL